MAQASDFATGVFTPFQAPAPPGRAQRMAVRLLQASALAMVLAASTHAAFELDRFFVPKELVLHLAALAVGLLSLAAARRMAWSGVDWLLAAFLLLGLVSAAFAQNPWLAARALAVSASGAVVFWAARALGRAGLSRAVVTGLAVAVVLAAATGLAQAYGLRLDVFSVNRAPGGTLGNRNFVAHACAFGLPVLLVSTLRAHRAAGWAAGAAGLAAVAAFLFLSRSRAGWLGAAAALIVFGIGWMLSGPVRRHVRTGVRLLLLLLLAGAGVAAAALLPNRLRWTSANPYAETAAGLVNYQEGSGRGRLIQYQNSLRMTAAHPVLGVGPGNWAVDYPRFAEAGDPSLDRSEAGMTSNPWPSSDWAAMTSERGLPAAALLLAVFAALGLAAAAGALRARDAEEGLAGIALAATIAATLVVGAFDAVLLLALPTLLVWAALGALSGELPSPVGRPVPGILRAGVAGLLLLATGAAAARSAAQIAAMHLHERGGRDALATAARLDPGSYRIRVRLARALTGRRNCAERREHAEAAQALFPEAAAPRSLGCRR